MARLPNCSLQAAWPSDPAPITLLDCLEWPGGHDLPEAKDKGQTSFWIRFNSSLYTGKEKSGILGVSEPRNTGAWETPESCVLSWYDLGVSLGPRPP